MRRKSFCFFFFALPASSTTIPCVQPQRFFLSSNWAVLRRIQVTPQDASQVALVVKNLPAIARGPRRHRFNPWVRNIPWRGKWLPTPVFLPGKSHGQSSLMGCSSWGCRVRHNWAHTHTHNSLAAGSNVQCLYFMESYTRESLCWNSFHRQEIGPQRGKATRSETERQFARKVTARISLF